MLHRFIGTSETRSPRYGAPPCGALCGMLRGARLDWAKAGLLRSPSGGAMRSCAVRERRRACDDQGHRAVRHRGDIRHRSNGACGLVRRCAVGAGVGGRGARADCNGRGCAGLCAEFWRRGIYGRWRRHVQGRLDLEHQGGACAQRKSRVRAPWYGMLRGAARPMDGAHGAAHACCGEWCTVYGALSRSGACEYLFVIVGEGATPSGRGVLHSGARAACAARCACARRTLCGEVSQRKDGCIEVYHVPKPRSGPVPPRFMRYRMRRCGMRCAYCTRLRCVLHRRALHVASARVACCIDARCIGSRCIAARCIGARCVGLCFLGPCCIGAAQPSRSARSCSPL
jgi:hypothetical protein